LVVRHGDRDAFAQLAATEAARLNAIARLVLRDVDLANDAVQETLVRGRSAPRPGAAPWTRGSHASR